MLRANWSKGRIHEWWAQTLWLQKVSSYMPSKQNCKLQMRRGSAKEKIWFLARCQRSVSFSPSSYCRIFGQTKLWIKSIRFVVYEKIRVDAYPCCIFSLEKYNDIFVVYVVRIQSIWFLRQRRLTAFSSISKKFSRSINNKDAWKSVQYSNISNRFSSVLAITRLIEFC